MKFLLLIIFAFNAIAFSQQNVVPNLSDNLKKTASVELVRKKEVLYSAMKARVNLNGRGPEYRITEIKNGKSEIIKVPEGRNTFYVSGFGTPGQSSVSFNAKSGENYSLMIAPRSSSFWAGVAGGVIGNAIETAIEKDITSEGGAFRISLQYPSEITNKYKTNYTSKPDLNFLQEELTKLRDLYEKGLISEEVYQERQKEIISN
tara:strand:- start:1295 stop:1906 length:612 start_codon:yes stop_codon:yes gene_type:complete